MDKVFLNDILLGSVFEVELTVTSKDTAVAFGSGGLEVLATPCLIALMESASYQLIQRYLDDGLTSVGTKVGIKHMAATPVGMKVRGIGKLEEIDGRRVLFSVQAFDEKELIGEGTHERFIVSEEKFMNKVSQK